MKQVRITDLPQATTLHGSESIPIVQDGVTVRASLAQMVAEQVGPVGPQGAAGPQGLTGATGATGPQGPVGATGATGPQGPTGTTGATGPQGPIGLTGATGATGAAGPQGPTGPTGATGATGPQGPIGLAGGSLNWLGAWSGAVTYAIDDAVTRNGSSYACAVANTNQQPPNATYWRVIAEAGATGATGQAGAAGATGPAGAAGATGATGATGPAGPGVATGGTAGQFLRKASSTNYDTAFATIAWEDVSKTGSSLANLATRVTANLTDFPAQTGNSGLYLTTNGTSLSWAAAASGWSATVVVATANYTVLPANNIIVVNRSSGSATTITLPSSRTAGQIHVIKDGRGDARTNNITVAGNGANIDGVSSRVINLNYAWVSLVWNGTQWNVWGDRSGGLVG